MWEEFRDRLRIWREVAWRPWWAIVAVLFATAANWDTLSEWFGLSQFYGIAGLIPQLSGTTWFILWLVLTVAVLLESVYGIACARNRLQALLDRKRRDQDLSDLLSDKHDYAIHELLNKPPLVDDATSFNEWNQRVHQWTQETIQLLKEHECTKQEIRSVNSLGLFQIIPLHKNPGVSHAMSMLVERMQRIADVARKYGE